jgi:cell division transport system permease protein
MNWMIIKRVIGAGAVSFLRNGFVSFATVLIMTVTLLIIGMLIFLSALLTNTLEAIQDKVDVNVYFVTSASAESISLLQEKIEQLPEVASVVFTTREEALDQFRERHAEDQLTLQALDELGDNPLGASISIKAKNPSEYESIANFLEEEPTLSSNGTSIIDHVNYFQNKEVIERLTSITHSVEQVGAVIVLLFAIASAVIVLATIRLAIYTARDEIGVMRLVGASNAFIRWPFIVSGILAGIVAAVVALAIFYPLMWYAGGTLTVWLGNFNLFSYYLSHFPMIFGLLVGSGVLLGGLSSFIAVRRYLKI